MQHQTGPITATYTSDWFLREGEYKRKLVTGGMVENDIGEIPRPKENAEGNYTWLPI